SPSTASCAWSRTRDPQSRARDTYRRRYLVSDIRLPPHRRLALASRQRAMAILSYASCCAATLVTVLALSMWRDSGQALLLLLFIALLASACLFVLYVPAVYAMLTSLSVATLILLRRNGGRMLETSLYDRFATRGIIQQRLCVLVGAGYLAENPCGFSPTSR